MEEKRIILNRIQTPDGTILVSEHVHDYKTHIDTNGLEYMVDGGTEYLRRSVHTTPLSFLQKAWIWIKGWFGYIYNDPLAYKEMSIYSDTSFEIIRDTFTWGTYGKDGKQPLKRVKLSCMSNDHIKNVLANERNGSKWVRELMNQELIYRKQNHFVVED